MSRSASSLVRTVKPVAVAMGAVIALVVATEAPAAAALPQGSPSQSGGVNGQVYATLVVGSTVYVGGDFSQAQVQGGASTTRTNLAAFNVNTGALLASWSANADSGVRSLATDGSFLYVGGQFANIGGRAQGRLARVSLSTGAVDAAFHPNITGSVLALQVRSGSVYAGGRFTLSSTQRNLAKFTAATGARVTAFNGSTDGQVDALSMSPDGTQLAVGGDFATLSGTSRTGLGLVSPTTAAVVGPTLQSSIRPMLSLDWSDDGVALFGGSGNSNNRVARWNPTSGTRSWSFSSGGDIQAIDYFDGFVYAGFHDEYQGNTHTKLLGVNAQTGAISSSFRPVFNQFWGVRSISAGPWGLVIGGQFTTISGVWAHNWARWPD